MDKYNSEINFYLPGLYHFLSVYGALLQNYVKHREKFKDNANIGCIYDCPGGIWNGGRSFPNQFSKEDLDMVCSLMRDKHIPIRFTFTNCLLKEEHIHDTYCNMLLEIYNTGKNEILCNSQILEDYIRNKYGNRYKYISSTTKRFQDNNLQLQELEKDYYLVVIDYDYNNDFDFLKTIKNKEKCELLCNPVCDPHCPRRKMHYESISLSQLENRLDKFKCINAGKHFWEVQKQENYIGPEAINDIYIPMGFKHFKLEGRTTSAFDLIEILLCYLIKEEYVPEMRDTLQRAIM